MQSAPHPSPAHDLLLRHVSHLVPLTEPEQVFFLSMLTEQTLPRKSFLVRAGDVCQYETFVVQGCLRAYAVDAKGQEHTLMFASEEWWISDFQSLLTGQPAQLYVEVLEDSTVLQIHSTDLDRLYATVPAFERFFRLKLQKAFVAFQQRILANISQTAEERYAHFVERYPQLLQRIPQYLIASFVGCTPEFLSRIRSQYAHRR